MKSANLTPQLLQKLQEQVKAEFSKPLNNDKDFTLLLVSIKDKVGILLSLSLIKRVLGRNNKNTLSDYTLDILTLYSTGLVYADWLKKYSLIAPVKSHNYILPDEAGLHLLDICLSREQFDIVYSYLETLPFSKDDLLLNSEIRHKLSRVLAKHFRANPKARKKLLPLLASLPQGRFYFFQEFVDLDYISTYFGKAILLYKQHTASITTLYDKDNCFADSLLFWKEVISNSHKNIKKKGYELFHNVDYKEVNTSISDSIIPLLRWHSNRIIYLYYANKISTKEIEDTLFFCESMLISSADKLYFCSIFFLTFLIIKEEHYIHPLYLKYKNSIESETKIRVETVAFYLLPKMQLYQEQKYELAGQIPISKEISAYKEFSTFMGKVDLSVMDNFTKKMI